MEDLDFHFSVTPLYDVELGDEDFALDMFEFEIEATFTHLPDQDDDDDLDFLDDLSSTTRQDTFMVERRADNESFRANVKCELQGLGVPAQIQSLLVDRIFNDAKSMESDKGFLGSKVIRLRFSIDVYVSNGYNDNDIVNTVMVPASKSSMDSLERVNVEGSNTQCSICLEKISVGFEAIRLPCVHIYHGKCICNWLEKNGICPLCRKVI